MGLSHFRLDNAFEYIQTNQLNNIDIVDLTKSLDPNNSALYEAQIELSGKGGEYVSNLHVEAAFSQDTGFIYSMNKDGKTLQEKLSNKWESFPDWRRPKEQNDPFNEVTYLPQIDCWPDVKMRAKVKKLCEPVSNKIEKLEEGDLTKEDKKVLHDIKTNLENLKEKPCYSHCQQLRKLADECNGKPAPVWKTLAASIFSIISGVLAIIGGLALTVSSFGALAPAGIPMVAAGSTLFAAGIGVTLYSRKRTGLSKQIVDCVDKVEENYSQYQVS
ncbi:MAG: hypothetical protein GY821_12450 [Gammaproteobacteria bacterium]|nr:hypothetical protein [Gammaproteobacteria bacterium]